MKIATLPPEPDGAGGAAGVRKDWGRSCRHHLLMTRAGRANERRTLKQMMLPIAAEKVGRETHTPRTGRFAGAWLIVSGLSKPRGRLLINLGHLDRRSDQQALHTPMLCSRATDGRSASKCQGKWPDQTLDHGPGCQWCWRQSSEPRTPLAKHRIFVKISAVWESSGESRIKAFMRIALVNLLREIAAADG